MLVGIELMVVFDVGFGYLLFEVIEVFECFFYFVGFVDDFDEVVY